MTVNVDDKDLIFGPHLPARRAAEAYRKSVATTIPLPKVYQKLNMARVKQIAKLYDEVEHQPDDPIVVAAYQALCE